MVRGEQKKQLNFEIYVASIKCTQFAAYWLWPGIGWVISFYDIILVLNSES